MTVDFGTYHHSNPVESREMRNRVAGAFSAVLLTLYEPHSVIRILDAGCGLGFLSYVAAKTFPEGVITGIDTFDNSSLSHSSMIKAENNMKLLEVDSRVHFFEHDLTLPIRSKVKYDLVISSLVFHNLGRRRFAGYENVFAVLKRKGYFVIGDFFPHDKTDTKFLTSFSELIEDGPGEGQGKWKYGIKILRKR